MRIPSVTIPGTTVSTAPLPSQGHLQPPTPGQYMFGGEMLPGRQFWRSHLGGGCGLGSSLGSMEGWWRVEATTTTLPSSSPPVASRHRGGGEGGWHISMS